MAQVVASERLLPSPHISLPVVVVESSSSSGHFLCVTSVPFRPLAFGSSVASRRRRRRRSSLVVVSRCPPPRDSGVSTSIVTSVVVVVVLSAWRPSSSSSSSVAVVVVVSCSCRLFSLTTYRHFRTVSPKTSSTEEEEALPSTPWSTVGRSGLERRRPHHHPSSRRRLPSAAGLPPGRRPRVESWR